jgi:hypothetical protein
MSSNEKGDATKAVARNLHEAIQRVREDVAKVEFWADAVTEFSQPAPEYKPGDANIWLPQEQAAKLGGTKKKLRGTQKKPRNECDDPTGG